MKVSKNVVNTSTKTRDGWDPLWVEDFAAGVDPEIASPEEGLWNLAVLRKYAREFLAKNRDCHIDGAEMVFQFLWLPSTRREQLRSEFLNGKT